MASDDPKSKQPSPFKVSFKPERAAGSVDPPFVFKPVAGSTEQIQADYWSKVVNGVKAALKPEFVKLDEKIDTHAKENQHRFDSLDAALSKILKRLDS